MKSEQNAQERMKQIRQSQKVYGRPKLPQKIDAMYDNICRGNIWAYYLDPDPVRDDPIYMKLGELKGKSYRTPTNISERVAEHFMNDMKSRQMREETYNYISKMPLWFLKLDFTARYVTSCALRKEIDNRLEYMFKCKDKEWLD